MLLNIDRLVCSYLEQGIANFEISKAHRFSCYRVSQLYCRVPTFWKVLKCPGNEKNVLESCKMSWKVLEIDEFSGNLGLLKFGMMTVVPFL